MGPAIVSRQIAHQFPANLALHSVDVSSGIGSGSLEKDVRVPPFTPVWDSRVAGLVCWVSIIVRIRRVY